MFESFISKIKQHPVLFVNGVFTFFCITSSLSNGMLISWLLLWILIPLLTPINVSFYCIPYMSIYMRIINNVKLFSILVCFSFVIILIKQIIYLNKQKLLNKYLKILFYYLFLLIIPVFYSLFANNSLTISFIYYLNMLNILLLVYLNKEKLNSQLLMTYVFGVFCSSILSVILWKGGFGGLPIHPDKLSRFTGSFPLCTSLSAICIICISLIYVLIVNKQITKRLGIALIGGLTLLGIITFSKTFLITFTAAFAIIVVYEFKNSKNKKLLATIYLSIFILLSPLLVYYSIAMYNRFFIQANHYSNIIDVITSGRLNKWVIYLKPWCKKLSTILFGVGICYDYPTEFSSHSWFVGGLSRTGLLGLFALIYFIFIIITNVKSCRHKFKYFPIIMLLLVCLVEDISFNTFYFIPFILAMCNPSKTSNK